MTWRTFAEKYLFNNGMFEADAAACCAYATKHNLLAAFERRWDEALEGYPTQLRGVFIASLRSIAVEWIEKNRPQAWYKAVFQD